MEVGGGTEEYRMPSKLVLNFSRFPDFTFIAVIRMRRRRVCCGMNSGLQGVCLHSVCDDALFSARVF